MRGTHSSQFQKVKAKRRKVVLCRESKVKVAQPYVQSTLGIDAPLHRGIPPGRPPDLSLMRGIMFWDSLLLDFGEVKSLEEKFGMRDVKVVDSSRRRATHARSPALSLRRVDPY